MKTIFSRSFLINSSTLKRSWQILPLMLLAFSVAQAQKVIRLYPGKAPGSENWTQKEEEFNHPKMTGLMVRNVVDPSLTVFKPAKPNGTAIIICPGGGFHWLSYQSEGTEVAQWLTARGVTAFVLKYRLVDTGPTMDDLNKAAKALTDRVSNAQKTDEASKDAWAKFSEEMKNVSTLATGDGVEAMKYVRQNAKQYGIDPAKVGMIGFSAGSSVEMGTILTGNAESVPNFAGHVYGGDTRGQKIPDNAPSLFILSAFDDPIARSNPDLLKQWQAAGKSAELHIYSKGGHGFGMKKQNMPVDSWIERFGDWLKLQGLITSTGQYN